MGEQAVICGWHDKYRSLWGHQAIGFGHQLHQLDLLAPHGKPHRELSLRALQHRSNE